MQKTFDHFIAIFERYYCLFLVSSLDEAYKTAMFYFNEKYLRSLRQNRAKDPNK